MNCPVCNAPLTQLRHGSVVYGCTASSLDHPEGYPRQFRLSASGVLVAEKFTSTTTAEFPPKG